MDGRWNNGPDRRQINVNKPIPIWRPSVSHVGFDADGNVPIVFRVY